MNWKTYLSESKRTLIDLGTADNLIHGAIGVCTEIGELKEAFDDINRKEELGDMFWYLAIFWRDLPQINWESPLLPLSETTSHADIANQTYSECLNTMDFYSKQLLDQAKRVKFYSMETDQFKTEVIEAICQNISFLIEKAGYNPELIWDTNINKLRQRFPNKFTSEDALNRDLGKERKILEQY